jgi:hypothetical protein
MFTTYNHVLGSTFTTIGMLPLDFEDENVEEKDGTFRPGVALNEPPKEYFFYDAAVITADLFHELPVSDDVNDDVMDVDDAKEDCSEEEDEDWDIDSEDDSEKDD